MTQRNEQSRTFSFFNLSGGKLLLLMSIIVVVFLIDSEVAIVADFISDKIATAEGIALFIGIAAVFSVGGYLVLSYVKQQNKHSKIRALYLNATFLGVSVAHYVLIATIAIVIIQILVMAQYSLYTIYTALFVSYGLWVATMALLSRAFLAWYRLSARNTMVLVLALSMIAYVVNGLTGLANYVLFLQQQPEVIASDRVAFFPSFDPDSTQQQINLVYQVSSAVAYVLTWIGTVMLLRPYIQRIGKVKFYAILGAAMVYYLINYPLFVLGYLTPTANNDTEIMNNILLTTVSSVFSGIVFAAAFLSVARTLEKGTALREYIIIAAYGFLLFYVAGSAVAAQAAFPPFGLASLSFAGLSCYLIYAGLYSSAATVSQDLVLRKSIRKSVQEQSKLLDSIGTAQMEQELQGKVLTVAKKASKAIEEETGVEPSMSEADMKDYVQLVIEEMQTKKKNTS